MCCNPNDEAIEFVKSYAANKNGKVVGFKTFCCQRQHQKMYAPYTCKPVNCGFQKYVNVREYDTRRPRGYHIIVPADKKSIKNFMDVGYTPVVCDIKDFVTAGWYANEKCEAVFKTYHISKKAYQNRMHLY